jgi:hypothetical protein
MELICQTFPHLRDVWVNHLEPFILPSKEEMDRRRFIVQFTIKLIGSWIPHSWTVSPRDPWWKTTHTSYVQPGVILCSSEGALWLYYIPDNFCCCYVEVTERDVADIGRTPRRVLIRRGVRFVLDDDNPDILCYDYDDHVEVINNELPQDMLSSLCPHVRYSLLMHAIRHQARVLRHVE